jgi:RNA polymerase sigma factor (TIGR02999 family)
MGMEPYDMPTSACRSLPRAVRSWHPRIRDRRMPPDGEITGLLAALREGDAGALDRLFPIVYHELRQRAHRQLAARRPGDTLSTTVLVHEAYLKLTGSACRDYHDGSHFFAVASRAMRQILVDYARRHAAAKRGGGHAVSLDPDRVADPGRAEELLELDEALSRLELLDERLARVVELRFFGGLSVEEAGEVLGISPRSVKRDWRKARAFLFQAISGADAPPES